MAQYDVYSLLKRSLNVTSEANKVVANNIASVNTEGYKRHYVPFEQVMNNTASSDKLKTTKSKHISGSGNNGKVQVKEDDTTSMREDGNNVDIEVEMSSQAANSLMYQSLVRMVSGKLTSTNSVIKGGK